MATLVERDVMVPMRDGVRLATDVYRPDDDGPHPVLVQRTPYDKSFAWFTAGLILNPLTAVDRGYVVVTQDVRGRAASEGTWTPFVNEADDGYDTVEWAAAQPWSTGSVGVFGSSYLGVTSLQAAAAAPPHLGAAIAYLASANCHSSWTYSGGAFELGFNLWWTSFLAWDTWARDGADPKVLAELSQVASDWPAAARQSALEEMPGFDRAAPYWRDWLAHPEYDDYWAASDAVRRAGDIRVPLLSVAGWYDNFLRGQLDLQAALQTDGHPDVRDEHRFIAGPWDHEAYLSVRPTSSGSREFGPVALGGVNMMTELALSWFDRWLRDGHGPDLPPVRYFVMGENRWAEAPAWPPEGKVELWRLHSAGGANGRDGGGSLSTAARSDNGGPDVFTHDPADPVPTIGGRTLAPIFAPGGIQDQAEVEARTDVLVYTSEPLTSPITVAGPIRATLHVATDQPRTDIAAKLVDVEPDGRAFNIAEGIRRSRFTPNEVSEVEIDLWDVAHTFQAGHRIRVQIAGSNFPRFDLAPVPAVVTIYHDDDRPSGIALPVITA